ncbi:MAG: radical SAM family heme chaperone HemW [Bacteroidales bacterium]|nr:radical SAM family heme chaperone HemW [Bacteroidales bacterium]
MIYIHIPFCRSFCTYCDFYSEVAAKCRKAEDQMQQEELFGRFADALEAEVRMRSDEITDQVNTLYIGGGTPSVLPLYVYERVLKALKEAGHGGPFDEFTMEVNPEDIVEKGHEYVEGLLRLGVNRVSMGVQSFDDGILRFMNRRHDADTARKAYAVLVEAGVKNISIDLIFGLPQLSEEQWRNTLKNALEISPDGMPPHHISSYQLSVEPGSMLARMVEKGMFEEASDDLCRKQYDMLCETLAAAGYEHYEISNFALSGHEAVHNSAYWRHVPYVGLGPGAHSFLIFPSRFVRKWNKDDLKSYINGSYSGGGYEELDEQQVVLEKIMLGLRTSSGISEAYLREHCDASELARALKQGNLVPSRGGNLRIPESLFFISDSIVASLV